MNSRGYAVEYAVALVYHGSGDHERTFHYLEEALKQRDVMLPSLMHDPIWQNLRSEPRLIAVLKNGLGEMSASVGGGLALNEPQEPD